MSLISNEVALKKLICKCSFLSFLLVCLFVFSSSFSFFQLFRFPLIWLMLRFKLKMNFHRGIAQTVCDVEYVTEPIRSLELRGFQPSTRRDQSGQKKMEITWNYMRDMLEKVKDTFSASLSRVFALVSILLYAMLLYVAICCYLFYLFYPWKKSPRYQKLPERTRHFLLLWNIAGEGEGHTGPRDQLVYVLNSWDKTPQHESGSFSSRCLGLLNWGYISSTSCIYSSKCDMLIEQDGYPTWYKIRERRIVYSPHATPPSPRPVELAWLTWYMYTRVQFFAEEWMALCASQPTSHGPWQHSWYKNHSWLTALC